MDKAEVSQVLAYAEHICQERGVRLTTQRRVVFRLLCESNKPLGAYELLELMRDVMKTPAPPTVYRALDFLCKQGLIHKLESLNAFVCCTHPKRAHTGQFLICGDCGEVAEVEDPSVAESLQAAGKAAGFRTQRRVVELLGVCADCSEKQQKHKARQ